MKIPLYFDNSDFEKNQIKKHNGFNLLDNKKLFYASDTPYSFIDEIIENRYIKIDNKYEGKYFYPIYFSCFLTNITKPISFPKKVLKDLKRNKAKILIVNPYEGFSLDIFEKIIYTFIIDYYKFIDKNKIILITGNLEKETNTGIKNIYYNAWERISSYYSRSDGWQTIFETNIENILKKQHKLNKFLCLQRRPRYQRLALFTELFDFRTKGILTLGTGDKDVNKKDKFNNIMLNFSKLYPESYAKFNEKNLYNVLPYEYDANLAEDNPVYDNNISKYLDSHLHIISETYFENQKKRLFFSEKIFKPIIFLRPFVLFGQTNSLTVLKDMGFKTFEKYIDESYDEILDDGERFKCAVKSVQDYIKLEDKILENNLKDMFLILMHNYYHLTNISKSNSYLVFYQLYQILN